MYKECNRCLTYKGLAEFRKAPANVDGLTLSCVKCLNRYKVEKALAISQDKLEERFNNGDDAIAFCKCGDYFKQVYYEGMSFAPSYREACKLCRTHGH